MVEEASVLLPEDFKSMQPPWRRVQLAAFSVTKVVSLLRKVLTEAPGPTLDALEKLALLVQQSADQGEPCEGFREAIGVAKYLPTTLAPVHNPGSNRGQRSAGAAIAQGIIAAAEAVLNPSSDATFTAYKEAVYVASKGSLETAIEDMHQEFERLRDLRSPPLGRSLPKADNSR